MPMCRMRHRDPADRRVAVPFPINGAAAIRAKMKSNPVAAVRVALADLSLAVEPLWDTLHRNGKTCRCGVGTPCNGKGKPDLVHL